jgi:transcription factor C subunit 7
LDSKPAFQNYRLTRKQFRGNFTVDHETGAYFTTVPSPTGIPSDPALVAHGVKQAEELGVKVTSLDPPLDMIYCSPYYRCLQTLKPTFRALQPGQKRLDGRMFPLVRVDNGLADFHGLAPFDHPSPAPLAELRELFDGVLDPDYAPTMIPDRRGDTVPSLHDRIAYALFRIISDLDADPRGPKAVLICTHAAAMIAMGRILTGHMPEDSNEEDFFCYTCSLSMYKRRAAPSVKEETALWDSVRPRMVPKVKWKGSGLLGGWDCLLNGDCSFLSGGEERGW